MNVQTWVEEDTAPDLRRDYQIVTCPACTRLHFIDKSTGRLFGVESE